MANEIAVSYITGATVTADVFVPAGTEREFDISLTETGEGGLYLGDCSTIVVGDKIVAYGDGDYIGGETYLADCINEIWRWFYKKKTATKSAIKTYTDADAVRTTQVVDFNGTTKTVGNAS